MKKTFLAVILSVSTISLVLAMTSNSTKNNDPKCHKQQHSDKLVSIYTKDASSSQIIDTITFKNQDNYNVFYCKDNSWCEVVNQKDGNVGWIDLGEFKKAQDKYAKRMYKKHLVQKLEQDNQLQGQRIAELQRVVIKMQKDFSLALQNQQIQINQLKQAIYR
ncbi:hypothetical protein IB642_05550 [Allofrancisella guangzhouensis]|uniref:Uncharacterized protein n=1 Tax=Allofrancisella guangzhouensis TaxID=594679 RepID=A0A0A8E470_9GAMM|nr:hypothetical protein [Allofrancisella guangzhouensis]AJC48803.1 hypothetical protein SD28_03720 [Allofrancisella guangzhouensis]MBK2027146.1 hypothetical protein [Allofrancisella guangzhouensis]MBK2044484.1 hypothetical protein [Allofrancisella guangzhouensis]MBK2046029.1 hypothetical protein [Allofrancisella guangzhouensis]